MDKLCANGESENPTELTRQIWKPFAAHDLEIIDKSSTCRLGNHHVVSTLEIFQMPRRFVDVAEAAPLDMILSFVDRPRAIDVLTCLTGDDRSLPAYEDFMRFTWDFDCQIGEHN